MTDLALEWLSARYCPECMTIYLDDPFDGTPVEICRCTKDQADYQEALRRSQPVKTIPIDVMVRGESRPALEGPTAAPAQR